MQDTSAQNKYQATGWKKKSRETEFDLELPSGQLCRVKKLRMESIVELGLMNDLDTFTGAIAVDSKAKKVTKAAETKAAKSFMESLTDKDKFAKLMGTVDKVVIATVLEPKVHADLAEGEEYNDDLVYLSDIEFEDKLHIFGTVFEGMGALGSFRERGQSDGVGAVAKESGSSL